MKVILHLRIDINNLTSGSFKSKRIFEEGQVIFQFFCIVYRHCNGALGVVVIYVFFPQVINFTFSQKPTVTILLFFFLL